MKINSKIFVSLTTIIVASMITFFFHDSKDIFGQINNGKDLTEGNYHVEINILTWIICAIINAVVWSKKEHKKVVKKIDFDFLKVEKERNHEK